MSPPMQAADPAVSLTDRERHEIKKRSAIGIAIAIFGLGALAGFVVVAPAWSVSVLLALGVISGGALIAWIYRCGDGHEHQHITGQNRAIIARLDRLQATVEGTERSVQGVHQRIGRQETRAESVSKEIEQLRRLVLEDDGVSVNGWKGPSPYS